FNHGFDVVIVWKLDRFARSRYDSAKYRAILRKNNVKVVSATEAISDSSEGIILEGMFEAMAEYYSADLAQKVKRGMTDNALKCRYNGGGSVPLGYVIDSDGHYQLDPANAAVALELFERYAEGEPVTQITDDLNARGLRTSRGRLFNKSSIRNLLKNRNYIGEYHYMDVVVTGGVPAIVSEDLFERANARLEKNKRVSGASKGTEKYILTTKLFCGECRAMMVGESGQKKNTGVYRYYKCAAAKRHECTKKAVRKELIEDYVVRKAMETVSDPETVDRIVRQVLDLQEKENASLLSLEAQLKDVRASIGNVVKAVESGMVNRTLQKRLNELEGEEIRLQNDIDREKALHPKLTEEQIRFMLSKYASLSIKSAAHREKLIDSLIGSILLYDSGKIIITFNYRDKKEEANIGEIAASAEHTGSDIAQDGSPTKHNSCKL
ncbi:MAG: recombinase family protein, partial [Clostridia bacterium]|nr:recombinase family protein [Clostridia bacterium]